MLSDVYESNIIHKSIIVATDEDATLRAAAEFRDYDIDATVVLDDHLEDDRGCYERKLRQFGSGIYQAICMPYSVWNLLRNNLELYISNTNVLVMYETEPEYNRLCVEWIADAQRRGFAMAENFLIHLIERQYDQG